MEQGVVYTIHQPRSNIVKLFDRLLLLSRGRIVYNGAATGARSFLEPLAFPCEPDTNPADYYLDVVNADSSTVIKCVAMNSLQGCAAHWRFPAFVPSHARPSSRRSLCLHGRMAAWPHGRMVAWPSAWLTRRGITTWACRYAEAFKKSAAYRAIRQRLNDHRLQKGSHADKLEYAQPGHRQVCVQSDSIRPAQRMPLWIPVIGTHHQTDCHAAPPPKVFPAMLRLWILPLPRCGRCLALRKIGAFCPGISG